MEVFEIKGRKIERQISNTSTRSIRGSKAGYILTMAGIILLTCALLVFLHFTREYSFWENQNLQLLENRAEKLEGQDKRKCDEPFCNSKECVSVAATLLEAMNPKVDPCTDFYEYACGYYDRVHSVPNGHASYSPYEEARFSILSDIRKMIESESLESETQVMKKIKKFYNSCMSSDQRNAEENQTLSFWFIDNELAPEDYIFGNSLDFDGPLQWSKLVSKLEEYQIHTLFEPHFVAAKHSAPNKIEVDCVVPFLKPEAYLNSSDDESAYQLILYREMMDAALELLHMDREAREEFIRDVIQIEENVAAAVITSQSSSNSYLVEEHKQQLQQIWRTVVGDAVLEMEVSSSCQYDLSSILIVLNDTPNKSVVKYVTWRMLMQLMQHMGNEFRNLHLHYLTQLPGYDYGHFSRWRQCADVVRTELGLAAMKGLIDKEYLKKEIIDTVNHEFLDIKRDALLFATNELQSRAIDGMDEKVSTMFHDKLKSMKLTTGYLDALNEEGTLDLVYSDMEIGDNYLMNIINLKRFKTRKYLTRLWYGQNGDSISAIPLEPSFLGTSSNYDYITNTVHLDIGLFRSPVYHVTGVIPGYLKYGYNSILARQMGRAFDATGILYDAEGHKTEKIWWPTSMEQTYDNYLSCLRNKIVQLQSRNEEINSTELINNVIADQASFRLPYEGLKIHLKDSLEEKPLPGVPLSKKQTFYVQTAQLFCEVRSKSSSDPDAKYLLPMKFRVNNAVSNMEDFAAVFNCPSASALHHVEKCSIFQKSSESQNELTDHN